MINPLPPKQSSKCRPLLFWCCRVLVNLGFNESGLSKIGFSQNLIFLRLLLLILPEVSPPFAQLFLAVPVAFFWLWVFVLWISAFLINLDFLYLRRRNLDCDNSSQITASGVASDREAGRIDL